MEYHRKREITLFFYNVYLKIIISISEGFLQCYLSLTVNVSKSYFSARINLTHSTINFNLAEWFCRTISPYFHKKMDITVSITQITCSSFMYDTLLSRILV